MEKLVIIGGGPAGLSAAIYASRALLNPLVIEGALPGGQLTQTSEIENYPGFPDGIQGIDLIRNFRKQAEKFNTRFSTHDVRTVTKVDGGFEIVLDNDEKIQTETILVATGANAKWLGIESETRLKGKGVSGCATCDGFFFREKVVAVIGGGDSAMEETLFLTKFASKVYVIHRRDSFRASKIMQDRVLNNPKVEVVWNKEVIEVLGENNVTGLQLKDTVSGEVSELKLDGMFLGIGHTPSTSFLKDINVLMDDKEYIYTTDRIAFEKVSTSEEFDPRFRYATNIPGIFAAGDCTDSTYRQAGTAVGMAIAAELEVEKYLEEKE